MIGKVLEDGIKNMVVYQDICLCVATKEELNSETDFGLNRLNRVGLTVNGKKYFCNCNRISFLGYSISKEGILLDQDLIQNILNVSIPISKKQLEAFLGLMNFYRQFWLKYSDLIESYANLHKNNKFIWSKEQQTAFDNLKGAIAEKRKIIS